MNPIAEYNDYRRYMRDYYEERKRTSYFSWREFAKLAGFSSSGYLKLVCDGKTRLRQDGALKVARAMELPDTVRNIFACWWNSAMRRTNAPVYRLSPGCVL
jgi:uncharacterized protein (TIGR02147 family)